MKHPKTPPVPLLTYGTEPEPDPAGFEFDDRTLASLVGQNRGSRNLATALGNDPDLDHVSPAEAMRRINGWRDR